MAKFSEYITESEVDSTIVEKKTSTERLDKEYKRQVAKKGTPLQKVLAYIGYKNPKLKKEVMEALGITQKMLDDEEWPFGGRTKWEEF